MPGLVGVAGEMPSSERSGLLQCMAQALKHEDWYQVHLYADDGIGLGRVSLGILNPEPQPIWNEDRSLCIVMEGEVYDYADEKRLLVERGHRFQVNNDPEYVLHLYEEYGEEFALKLNGAFVAAIWEPGERRLLVVNDRWGLCSLFYAQCGGHFLLAGGTLAILADPAYRPRVDPVAVAEFCTFEHVLWHRTLLEGVHLLPPASLLSYQDGVLSLRSYWDFQFVEEYEDHPEAWYIERWAHLMRQAVRRCWRDDGSAGVLLSGGLDSRVVLAMMEGLYDRVHSFTFGIPGCDDARLAQEVASKLGTRHHFFELKPDYLREVAEEGVRLTDGLKSCTHMHVLATLPQVAQWVQVLYTGSLGDSIMGDHLRRELLAVYKEDVLARMLFRRYNTGFPEKEQAQLFSPPLYRQIKGQAFESFRQALKESRASLAANKREHYSIRQNERRWILEGQRLLRSRVIVRTPFYDNDLVEFMLRVPPGLRMEGYFYQRAFATAFPELAKIPWEATGQPLVPCMRNLGIQFAHRLRWRLRAAGLRFVSPPQHRPYADYDGWMRTTLRPWVESILLDRRTLERGYFNPDYIRNLVAEHMAGANHARKLGVLLTLELWHRLFLD